MKKFALVLVCLVAGLIIFAGIGGGASATPDATFLRVHIRANSNLEKDQDVKYLVKESVVNSLTPLFSNITTFEAAIVALQQNLDAIEQVADSVLKENGFSYTSSASVNNEYFPTRIYNDVSLEQGFYDALIINLGTGEGDNWWCVVYPPLCFLDNTLTGKNSVEYKSKLWEIIERTL